MNISMEEGKGDVAKSLQFLFPKVQRIRYHSRGYAVCFRKKYRDRSVPGVQAQEETWNERSNHEN